MSLGVYFAIVFGSLIGVLLLCAALNLIEARRLERNLERRQAIHAEILREEREARR